MTIAYLSKNDGQFSGGNSVTISLTNAPAAGGMIVVCVACFTGTATGGPSVSATGGSGVTITERIDTTGAASTVGVAIYTVDYSTAPSSLTVSLSGAGTSGFLTATCANLSGQAASYLDGTGSGALSGTTATASSLPDLTDATDIVIGVMTRDGTTGTISPGTNWTQISEIDEANSIQTLNAIYRIPGATGAFDPTWTLSVSDSWKAAAISIKGTAGGGGSSIKRSVAQTTGGMRDLTGGTS